MFAMIVKEILLKQWACPLDITIQKTTPLEYST
jgi:hypothetical protein